MSNKEPGLISLEYKNVRAGKELDTTWTYKKFQENFRVVIVRCENYEMEFDLIGIHPFLANAFRRIMISDVPTMAIEKVHIYNNTSVMQDEILAHRLGLVPLKADPGLFEFKESETSEATAQDTLQFELKMKCSKNKENKDSSRHDDIYKNHHVLSKHIKWMPIGNQAELHKEENIRPIHDDISLLKMRPGHEIDLQMFAVKGTGRDHAKFSPVATAFYRLLPDIKLTRTVEGEQAERLQKCFSPGVIALRKSEGKCVAVVNDSRYDMCSRNVFKHDDLKDSVVMGRIEDHFIFTIESVGNLKSHQIFKEAINILKKKCKTLLDEIDISN
ncbi:PREDICTED: DNA-directed RNA polymerases I and III subunit RPAC1 [Nicrophorus vespilloides]|uniref:DNA-directed RNA polymerases I and III subunit RPAC1 n=1 Tax=Nicrophorus vespilloides TaxID=110193 RepID=A0ABM1MP28_NICVS|nr:PREDICTED: DNA-directed RNA polymerases I and III subunit RPAC1 [Nicrophorus vespilloides]